VKGFGAATGVVVDVVTAVADFAKRRGETPATATKPSNFPIKLLRDGS